MSDKRYNVAVIGYGLSAKIFNIPFIVPVPTLHLYGIVQRHPTPDDDAAKDFPGVRTWRSSEEMLQDEQVDVVVVTTIPGSHFDLAKTALEKGKHVVVEKPFVPRWREAEELRKVAERVGRLCTVFQNRVCIPGRTKSSTEILSLRTVTVEKYMQFALDGRPSRSKHPRQPLSLSAHCASPTP